MQVWFPAKSKFWGCRNALKWLGGSVATPWNAQGWRGGPRHPLNPPLFRRPLWRDPRSDDLPGSSLHFKQFKMADDSRCRILFLDDERLYEFSLEDVPERDPVQELQQRVQGRANLKTINLINRSIRSILYISFPCGIHLFRYKWSLFTPLPLFPPNEWNKPKYLVWELVQNKARDFNLLC